MFNLAGLGGSFDHLHKGHKLLITTALEVAEKIVIGLTTDELLKDKKYASKIQSYKRRKDALMSYLQELGESERAEIVPLREPYGPPVREKKYEALIVSQETYETALKMNEMREEKGFPPLVLVVIPIIKDKNERKLSSTHIRRNL